MATAEIHCIKQEKVQDKTSKRISVTPHHVDDGEADDASDMVIDNDIETNDDDGDKTNGDLVNGQDSAIFNDKDMKDDQDAISDSQGNKFLPDGTLVIHPEAADNDDFKGPEFPYTLHQHRKKMVEEQIIVCTSCSNQVNHKMKMDFKKHPVLGVILCRKCYKYYNSGNFTTDENGMDEYCRWCAEGGKLVCCDFCHNAFCKECIRRNFGRKKISEIMNLEQWKCFICNPAPLEELKIVCDLVMTKVDQNKSKCLNSSRLKSHNVSAVNDDAALGETFVGECVEHTYKALSMMDSKLKSYSKTLRSSASDDTLFNVAKKFKQNLHMTRSNLAIIHKHLSDWENAQLKKSKTNGTDIDQAKPGSSKTCTSEVIHMKSKVTKKEKSVDTIPTGKSVEKSLRKRTIKKDFSPEDLVETLHLSPKQKNSNLSKTKDGGGNIGAKVIEGKEVKIHEKTLEKDSKVSGNVDKNVTQSLSGTADAEVDESPNDELSLDENIKDLKSELHQQESNRISNTKPLKHVQDSSRDESNTEDDIELSDTQKSQAGSSHKKISSSVMEAQSLIEDISSDTFVEDNNLGTVADEIDMEARKNIASMFEKKDIKSDNDADVKVASQELFEDSNDGDVTKAINSIIDDLVEGEDSVGADDKDGNSCPVDMNAESTSKSDSDDGSIDYDAVGDGFDNREEDDSDKEHTTTNCKTLVVEKSIEGLSDDNSQEENTAAKQPKTKKKRKSLEERLEEDKIIEENPVDLHQKDEDLRSTDNTMLSDHDDDDASLLGKKNIAKEKKNKKKQNKSKRSAGKESNKVGEENTDDENDVEIPVTVSNGDADEDRSNVVESVSGESDTNDFEMSKENEKFLDNQCSKDTIKIKEGKNSSDDDVDDGRKSDSDGEQVLNDGKKVAKEERNDGDRVVKEKINEDDEVVKEEINEDDKVAKEEINEDDNELAKRKLQVELVLNDWASNSDESENESSPKRKRKITPKKKRLSKRSSNRVKKKKESKSKQKLTSDVDSISSSSSDDDDDSQTRKKILKDINDSELNDKLKMKAVVQLERLNDKKLLSTGSTVVPTKSINSKRSKSPPEDSAKERSDNKHGDLDSSSDLDKQIQRLCDVKQLKVKRKSLKRERKSSSSSNNSTDTLKHKKKRIKEMPKNRKSPLKNSLINLSSNSESDQDAVEEDSKTFYDTSKSEEKFSKIKRDLAKSYLEDDMTKISSNNSDISSDSDFETKTKKVKAEKKESITKKKDDSVKSEEEKEDEKKDDDDDDEKDNNVSDGDEKDNNVSDGDKKANNSSDEANEDGDEANNDGDEDHEEDSSSNKKKKRGKHKLLKVKLSESDSDFEPKRTKLDKTKKEKVEGNKKGKGRRRRVISDSDESEVNLSSEEDSEKDSASSDEGKRKTRSKKATEDKKKSKRRRRVKEVNSSSDGTDAGGSDDDDNDGTPSGKGRKNIRKVIKDSKLHAETKAAAREEEERRQRVIDRQKLYNEVIVGETKDGWPVTRKLVLDKNLETEEDLVEVHEVLIEKLKPHQVQGVRFLWETLCESLDRMKTHPGSGCILAHCMGLGKTLQVITFVHTILSNPLTKLTTCLVVCPLNTVLNWENEFSTWLDDNGIGLTVYELTKVKNNWHRADTLKGWHEDGGVMIMGYDMFRNLVQEKGKRVNKRQREIFLRTLIDPGPDVVICDEGHILKNDATALAKSMNRITTRRRVVLTGTPLQNNLSEYHCMVHFVKPNLLGTRKEFQNRFMNPIVNGQMADSTPHDFRLMKRRAHILHNLLEGCVQRRDYNVLVPFLPPKHEYVISIKLSDIQIKLYSYFLENFARGKMGSIKGSGLFADYQSLMKIWTHPYVLKLAEIRDENKAQYNSDDSFIDDETPATSSSDSESDVQCLDEPSSSRGKTKKKGSASDNSDVEVINNWQTRRRRGDPEEFIPETPRDTASKEWWTEIVSEEDAMKFELGGKLVLLFDILQECEAIGDKVLVFSQSLLSLDLIERMLNNMEEFTTHNPNQENKSDYSNTWIKGVDYFRMDGSTQADLRQRCTEMFNEADNIRARLFLISTRAGGLGINLVSANRVVIFDASWNPTHDVQSIFRVYRFGQKKPVYVYRFLAQGTMEEKIYDRQISKLSLSCRVVDEQQIERHFNAADLQELYIFTPETTSSKATPIVPKDRLLAELIMRQKEWLAGYHEHDSLLESKEEENLTEEERKAAWAEYEAEKKGLISATTSLGFSSAVGPMDINTIIEKIQQQWPGIGQDDLNQKVDQVLVWLRHQQQQQQMQAYQQRQQLYQQQQQQYYQQQQLLQQQQQYAMMNQYRQQQWPDQHGSYNVPDAASMYPQQDAMPSADHQNSSNDHVKDADPSDEPSSK